MFRTDPQVVYFFVHKFDSGTFYLGGGDGNYKSIQREHGMGYNINVSLKTTQMVWNKRAHEVFDRISQTRFGYIESNDSWICSKHAW